jgi:alkanesulfonate monooxygenase SsuD/methylene tetrahydromethanopterin reductase-like flavin-dependent oxidoreductase (luciferase family)
VERTAAVLVALDDGAGRRQGHELRGSGGGLTGSPEEIAAGLLSFHAAGITHLQLVVDPITLRSIEALIPVLEHVRREIAR